MAGFYQKTRFWNSLSTLPALGSSITLDGTTEPGFAGTPLIALTTAAPGSVSPGLTIAGNGNTILGLELIGFFVPVGLVMAPPAIALLVPGNNNVISGNLLEHNSVGISVTGSDNTIGGTNAAERNVIAGNNAGIEITGQAGSPITGDVVEGNYIGTDATGTKAIADLGPQFSSGGVIAVMTTGLVIGGTAVGAGNLISGNDGDGISISNSSGAMVQGNLIGTDVTGTQALGGGGILLVDTSGSTVGGTTTAARNVISANNTNIGIQSVGPGINGLPQATNDLIEGNFIGTQIDGLSPLPNVAEYGVYIDASDNEVIGNTIAFNGLRPFNGSGVRVDDGSGNRISQNSMFDNGTIGIQLGSEPYAPNGSNPGPNNSQNFPIITSATESGGNTVITGTLTSQANSTYTLEFYAASDRDTGDMVEGRVYLGSQSVVTDGSGNASFTFTGPANPGPFFTATATDANGDTSEFWEPSIPAPTISSFEVTSLDNNKGPNDGTTNGSVSVSLTINGSNFFTTTFPYTNNTPSTESVDLISNSQLHMTVDLVSYSSNGFGFTATFGPVNLTFVNPIGGSSNSVTIAATANQLFVAHVYNDLLGRGADAAGLANWTSLLDSGVAPSQIVLDIEGSAEYRADEVQSIYQRYLHRAADPSGLLGGATFLENGGTVEQLAAAIIASPEYFQNRGGSTNLGFLTALYQDALGRALDPSGQSTWLQAFANGATRYQVAGAIITSVECRQDFVELWYSTYLRRSADSDGLNYWLTFMEQGTSDETVVANIIGSQEYFKNVTATYL